MEWINKNIIKIFFYVVILFFSFQAKGYIYITPYIGTELGFQKQKYGPIIDGDAFIIRTESYKLGIPVGVTGIIKLWYLNFGYNYQKSFGNISYLQAKTTVDDNWTDGRYEETSLKWKVGVSSRRKAWTLWYGRSQKLQYDITTHYNPDETPLRYEGVEESISISYDFKAPFKFEMGFSQSTYRSFTKEGVKYDIPQFLSDARYQLVRNYKIFAQVAYRQNITPVFVRFFKWVGFLSFISKKPRGRLKWKKYEPIGKR